MEDTLNVIEQAEQFATQILENEVSEKFVYHNYYHTSRVVEAAKLIGTECKLSETDLEIVTVAAWFHDTGYKNGCVKHEESGAIIAREFLSSIGYPEERIRKVEGCIMATQMPQNPTNLLEEVICDADLHHLACSDYKDMSDRMQQEIEHVKGEKIDDPSWNEMNLQFFKDHQYFTEYGKTKLQPIKEENLKVIKKAKKKKKKDEE